jgi:hypothetical protein
MPKAIYWITYWRYAGLGAAAGAGAGLLGGLLVDQSRQAQDRAFQQGFAAGQQSR